MAEDNIKDFTVTWILAGVIIFALLTFALTFVYNNNPSALGENEEQITILKGNFSNSLQEVEGESNTQFNTSAQLNSEDTVIGTASASSTSYGFAGTGQSKWTIIKQMIAWVFAGTFGQILIRILSGLFGIVALYYVIKLIRSLF
jgi:hypothetical protein